MKYSLRLALVLVLALVLAHGGERPMATERMQYTPAAVVPVLGIRG